MSSYFTVRIFIENPRGEFSVLVKNAGNKTHPWGVGGNENPYRFLWKEVAHDALRQFMAYEKEHSVYVRGEIFHVCEKHTMLYETRETVQGSAAEPASAPETEELAYEPLAFDPREGEALVAASENLKEGEDFCEPYQEAAHWLYEHANDLLAWVRKGQRLDWLRLHPEHCRSTKDCQKLRKEGFIFCTDCMENGVGGYFDVYRRYYVNLYNDELEKKLLPILEQFNTLKERVEASQP